MSMRSLGTTPFRCADRRPNATRGNVSVRLAILLGNPWDADVPTADVVTSLVVQRIRRGRFETDEEGGDGLVAELDLVGHLRELAGWGDPDPGRAAEGLALPDDDLGVDGDSGLEQDLN